ncbi:response regulator [Methanocella sp. MCL-LM]|uniref:response regulator n=1 Tax=Methanocella sp. MCL-LM TaxID=3412035 RepID=UPI003C72FF45
MNERILIVEDEAIVLLDIRSRLAGLGYSVVGTASTGEEAIVKANATRPDAILMDIGLKGSIDGISAAEAIRKTQDTPIIYLTANSDITTLQRAKITGPFGYVLKPFDERELRVTIEMALYKHRMDRDLYDARQWLKVTLRNIDEGVITSDDSGAVKFMNTAAEELTGWELKDAAGKDVHSIFRLEQPEEIHASGSSQASLLSKEGGRMPIDYMLVPIEDDWGRVMGTVAIFKDMTKQKQAEQKLSRAEEQLCALMGLISDAICICDPEGTILCGNQVTASLPGLPAEDLTAKNLFEIGLFSSTDIQKVTSMFEKALMTGSSGSGVVTLTGRDGVASEKSIRVAPVKSGQEPMVMVVLADTGK